VRKHKKLTLGRVILYIVAYIFAFLWLFPIFWMLVSALKPVGTPVSILSKVFTGTFTFRNFILVGEKAPVWTWSLNSLIVSSAVTFGTIALTSMAAYSLSKLNFKGRGLTQLIITAGMMIPIEAIIIPLYQTMAELNLLNTYSGLVFPSLAAPIGVLIMKRCFDSIPDELIEASVLDGANPFQRWWQVCLPLSKSSMAAVGIFTFKNAWNDFLWPFLSITSEKMMTLPVGIPQFQGANLSEFVLPMTASVIASVPALIVFLIFQKQIMQGIAMTGIKG
jgi:multiple sugar transport system permease protein